MNNFRIEGLRKALHSVFIYLFKFRNHTSSSFKLGILWLTFAANHKLTSFSLSWLSRAHHLATALMFKGAIRRQSKLHERLIARFRFSEHKNCSIRRPTFPSLRLDTHAACL